MLVCKNVNNVSVHYVFEDFKCWTSSHIIHAAFAILTLQVFLGLSMIISLTYYKPMGSANDVSTKINSRADTFVLTEKIALTCVFAFLHDSSY